MRLNLKKDGDELGVRLNLEQKDGEVLGVQFDL